MTKKELLTELEITQKNLYWIILNLERGNLREHQLKMVIDELAIEELNLMDILSRAEKDEDEISNNERVEILLTPFLNNKLEIKAEEQGVSKSRYIRMLLE